MSAKLLQFRIAFGKPRYWTNQELAELYRVADVLVQAGLTVETDAGTTDEGDPWFVFHRPDTCDVVAHFARIDGQFIVCNVATGESFTGPDFRDIINHLLKTQPLLLPQAKSGKGGSLFLHPSVVLTAFVAMAWMCAEGKNTAHAGTLSDLLSKESANADDSAAHPSAHDAAWAAQPESARHNMADKHAQFTLSALQNAAVISAIVIATSLLTSNDPALAFSPLDLPMETDKSGGALAKAYVGTIIAPSVNWLDQDGALPLHSSALPQHADGLALPTQSSATVVVATEVFHYQTPAASNPTEIKTGFWSINNSPSDPSPKEKALPVIMPMMEINVRDDLIPTHAAAETVVATQNLSATISSAIAATAHSKTSESLPSTGGVVEEPVKVSFVNETHRLYTVVTVAYDKLDPDIIRLFQATSNKAFDLTQTTLNSEKMKTVELVPVAASETGGGATNAVSEKGAAALHANADNGDAKDLNATNASSSVTTPTDTSKATNDGHTGAASQSSSPETSLAIPSHKEPALVTITTPDGLSAIEKITWFANNANLFVNVDQADTGKLLNIETFAHDVFGEFKRIVVFDSNTLPLNLFYFGPDILLVDQDVLGGHAALEGAAITNTAITLPNGGILTLIGLIDVSHA